MYPLLLESWLLGFDATVCNMLDKIFLGGTAGLLLFRPAAESSTAPNPYECHVTCRIDPYLYRPPAGTFKVKWGRVLSSAYQFALRILVSKFPR
jgi:hypothetical protein